MHFSASALVSFAVLLPLGIGQTSAAPGKSNHRTLGYYCMSLKSVHKLVQVICSCYKPGRDAAKLRLA